MLSVLAPTKQQMQGICVKVSVGSQLSFLESLWGKAIDKDTLSVLMVFLNTEVKRVRFKSRSVELELLSLL